jgi:hypothetical protein
MTTNNMWFDKTDKTSVTTKELDNFISSKALTFLQTELDDMMRGIRLFPTRGNGLFSLSAIML